MAYVPPHRRGGPVASPPAPVPVPPPVTSAGICIYNHPKQTVLIGVDGAYGVVQVNYRIARDGNFRTVQDFINVFGERLPNFPNGNHITTAALNAQLATQAGAIQQVAIQQDVNILNTTLDQIPVVLGMTTFQFINRFLLPETFVNRNNPDNIHLVEHRSSIRFYERVGLPGRFRNGYPHGQNEINDNNIIIPGRPGPPLCNTALREFNEETGFDLANIPPPIILAPGPPGQPIFIENRLYNRGIINWANGQYINGNHIGLPTNAQSQYYFMRIDDATEDLILNAYWGAGNRAAVMGQGYRYNSELFNLRFINTNHDFIVNGHTAFVTTQLRTANVIPQANFLGGSIYLHKLQKYQNKLNKN
jgi:hypothetical protein